MNHRVEIVLPDETVPTATAKSALLADPEVTSLDVKVETRKGEVQLSGFVDNQGQIDKAVSNEMGIKK